MSSSDSSMSSSDSESSSSIDLVRKLKAVSINEPEHKIIVGIDYGTTYSGISFVTTVKKKSQDEITVIKNWPGDSIGSVKTPTRIAYSAENSTITTNKWGFEVYPRLKSYSWTKLLLDKNAAVGEYDDPSLSAIIGRGEFPLPAGRDAAGVCEDFLHELYLFVSQKLREQLTDVLFENTRMECWVTLPAIWSDEAKAATLTAAKNAGFGKKPDDEVFTIAEPEAAAIAALTKYAKRDALNPIKTNENIMICDCGGGTVDITTYTITQVQPYLEFDELCVGIGGKCGSTYINRNLHKLLSERYGAAWDDLPYKVKGPGSYFMNSFEVIKKSLWSNDAAENRWLGPIDLDVSESEHYQDRTVKISHEDLKSLFDPVIAEIVSLIEQQVEEADTEKDAEIDRIVLVGGFGDSSYLYQTLSDWCMKNGGIMLIRPENPQAAVVQGAALRGLIGIAPRTKHARRHYGFSLSEKFREGIDPEKYGYYDKFSDKKFCSHRMTWLISKGDETTEDTYITQNVERPYKPGKKVASTIDLYCCSLTRAPEYSTDPGVEFVGTIESYFAADFDFGDNTKSLYSRKQRRKVHRLSYEVQVRFGEKGENLTFKSFANGKQAGMATIKFER